MTPIEQALFLDASAHWVSAFQVLPDAIILTVHPCHHPEAQVHAQFVRPRSISRDDSHAAGPSDFPWDIIGFDSETMPDGCWRFCLHTDSVEYVFESAWPEIIKPANKTLETNADSASLRRHRSAFRWLY